MRGDTRRWLDSELPEELRSVLQSAQEDQADAKQLERLRKSVEKAIGPAAFELAAPRPSEPAATSGTAGASHSLTSALPWALTAIAAIGLATLAARLLPSSEPPPAPAQTEATPKPQRGAVAHATLFEPKLPSTPLQLPAAAPQPPPVPRTPVAVRSAAPRPTLAEELASLDRIRGQLENPEQAARTVRRHAAVFRDGALIPERQLLELEIALREADLPKVKRLSKPMTKPNSTFPYRARALKLLSDFGL
jgi:hypothetical protein